MGLKCGQGRVVKDNRQAGPCMASVHGRCMGGAWVHGSLVAWVDGCQPYGGVLQLGVPWNDKSSGTQTSRTRPSFPLRKLGTVDLFELPALPWGTYDKRHENRLYIFTISSITLRPGFCWFPKSNFTLKLFVQNLYSAYLDARFTKSRINQSSQIFLGL